MTRMAPRSHGTGAAPRPRGPLERAWPGCSPGPLGHLYGLLADLAVLWARYRGSRLGARLGRRRQGRSGPVAPPGGRGAPPSGVGAVVLALSAWLRVCGRSGRRSWSRRWPGCSPVVWSSSWSGRVAMVGGPPKKVVRAWDASEPPKRSSGNVSAATAMANATRAVASTILRCSRRRPAGGRPSAAAEVGRRAAAPPRAASGAQSSRRAAGGPAVRGRVGHRGRRRGAEPGDALGGTAVELARQRDEDGREVTADRRPAAQKCEMTMAAVSERGSRLSGLGEACCRHPRRGARLGT